MTLRGDPGFFLGGGVLVSCSTSTLINHTVFSQGGGGGGCTQPLHPPPGSVPDTSNNRRLGRVGKRSKTIRGQRSKGFCFNTVLCISLSISFISTHHTRLKVIEGWPHNTHDQLQHVHYIHAHVIVAISYFIIT